VATSVTAIQVRASAIRFIRQFLQLMFCF